MVRVRGGFDPRRLEEQIPPGGVVRQIVEAPFHIACRAKAAAEHKIVGARGRTSALNHMSAIGVNGIEVVAVNAPAQALAVSRALDWLLIRRASPPDRGADGDSLDEVLAGANVVFVTIQLQQRGRSARWWAACGGLVLGILLLLVSGLAILSAARLPSWLDAVAPTPGPAQLLPGQIAAPVPSVTAPAVATVSPEPATPSPATPVPGPPVSPTRYASIGETGGRGVYLRGEPGTTAAAVTALAQEAVVRLLGPEQHGADGRLWWQVEDSQGQQGWVPADFLVETLPPDAD